MIFGIWSHNIQWKTHLRLPLLWEQSPFYFIEISQRLKTVTSEVRGSTELSGTTQHFAVLAGQHCTRCSRTGLCCQTRAGVCKLQCNGLASFQGYILRTHCCICSYNILFICCNISMFTQQLAATNVTLQTSTEARFYSTRVQRQRYSSTSQQYNLAKQSPCATSHGPDLCEGAPVSLLRGGGDI